MPPSSYQSEPSPAQFVQRPNGFDSPGGGSSGQGRKIAIAVIIFVAVVGAALYWSFRPTGVTPASAFATARENLLTTKTVSATIIQGNTTTNLKYDLDPTATKLAGSVTATGLGTQLDTYATIKDSYVYFRRAGDAPSAGRAKLINHWVQVRQNGESPDVTWMQGLDALFDPHQALLEDVPFGDVDPGDRSILSNLAKDAFGTDPSKAVPATINDESAYVYEITVNSAKLREYQSRMAQIYGIEPAAASAVIDNRTYQSMRWFVSADEPRLLAVEVTRDGSNRSTTYADHNQTTLPEAPQPAAQITEFSGL